jgi:hypothetical protein
VKLLLLAGLVLAGVLVLTLASFWLAVRPPRLAIALSPAEYGLAVLFEARLADFFRRALAKEVVS